jgi:hypothetical protein
MNHDAHVFVQTCVYDKLCTVDILKVQGREGVNEDFDGVQWTVLSDLFLHWPSLENSVNQVVYMASLNAVTLSDSVGREAEHAWNIWVRYPDIIYECGGPRAA